MIRSPIKWAGGKARVMPQLLKHLPKADCLIEPFVGTPETHAIYSPAFALHSFSVRRSVSAKSRDMAGEVIGVLIDRARSTLATQSEASTIGDQADAN